MICVFLMSPPKSCSRQRVFLLVKILLGAHCWTHNCTKLHTIHTLKLHTYIYNYMHQHLYLLVTTVTQIPSHIQFYCSPLLNFAEKLEMNKKDNNSIFITEKRCDMKLFEFFSLYWVYIRSLNYNGSMNMKYSWSTWCMYYSICENFNACWKRLTTKKNCNNYLII